MSKDIAGRELAVGDKVAVCVPYYKTLQTQVVIAVTPKGARVGSSMDDTHYMNRSGDQICKLES